MPIGFAIDLMISMIRLLAIVLTVIVVILINFIKLLIYIIKNVIIVDLFAVLSVSSCYIYNLFKVSTTAGLIKTVIAGAIIGIISISLTRIKYVGKVLAEIYGIFWGVLLFFAIKKLWILSGIYSDKLWIGIIIGVVVGIGAAVWHHFSFKNNTDDVFESILEIIFDIKTFFTPKKAKKEYVNVPNESESYTDYEEIEETKNEVEENEVSDNRYDLWQDIAKELQEKNNFKQ